MNCSIDFQTRNVFIFDLGETLIDFNKADFWYESLKTECIPLMYRALNQNSPKFNQQKIKLVDFQERVYPIIAKQIPSEKLLKMETRIQEYFTFYQIPASPELIQTQFDAFYSTLIKTATLFPEVIEILQILKNKRFNLGLWSDTPWQCPGILIKRIMKHFNILEFFSSTLFSGDFEMRKPNPLVLERVSKSMNIQKDRMIYIGNAENDIKVAANFGIPSIWINRNNERLGRNCPSPNLIIHSLLDLKEYIK